MGRSRRIVRGVFTAVIFALLFLCATAVFIPASKWAKAENTYASKSDGLGDIGVTYVIGDSSVKDMFGAVFVDENKPEYGMYYQDEETNTFTYSEHEWGWAAAMAVGASASSVNDRVRVVLASDWIAQRTDRKAQFRDKTIYLATSFGISESVFPYGRLDVPQGAYIQLDLNGNVLDRALTNPVEWFGQVIYGKNCHIEITDGNSENPHKNGTVDKYVYQENDETVAVNGGLITGGYTTFSYGSDNYYNYDISGGGIVVNVDSDLPKLGLTLNGGTIFGIRDNHSGRSDGGTSVLLYSTTSGTFTMNDGAAIIKSTGYNPAPVVGVYGVGKLAACNINGGTIAHSTSFNVIYAGARLNITGGEIRNNTTKQAVIYAHDATISGGKIFDNDCTYGVISTLGTDSRHSKDKIVMTGGDICYNRVTEYDNSSAGSAATVYLSEHIDFELNGGRIHHNEVTLNFNGAYLSSDIAAAGGVYVSANNGIFTMNGGEITDNVAMTVRDQDVGNANRLYICGGVIIGNKSGGVVSYMNGGTIARNVGKFTEEFSGYKYACGGVLTSEGTMSAENVFEMTGGEISNNEGIVTKDRGNKNYVVGGVYIFHCGKLWMGGGSIVGNKASTDNGAGLRVEGVSYGYFWGKPVIKDNVNTADGSIDNAAIPSFRAVGMFEDGAHISISSNGANTLADYTYFNNDVYDKKGKYTANDYTMFEFNYCVDPAKYLHCDSDEYIAVLDRANNSATFVNKSALAAKPTFEAAYSTDAEPSLQAIDDYGAKYTYADGAQFKFRLLIGDNDVTDTVKLTNSTGASVTEITDAGKYELKYQYGSDNIIYNIAVLPRELTIDDVTVVLDNSEYDYDGAEKRPNVNSITFDGKQISAGDYSVSYENNVDAGTGYVVIKFWDYGVNYSGTIKAPFAITIDGGQYNVVWQYYNGTAWATLAENTAIEYLPGARGNQINKIRAKLTASGSDAFTETMYAYADGVVDYNDDTLTETDISTIYVSCKLDGETVAAFRQVGEYTVSLAGEGKLPYGGAHECSVGIAAYEVEDNELLDARLIGADGYVYDGNAKSPKVNILLDKLALMEGTDYTVTYTDGVNADAAVLGGDAKAIVTFVGNYSGSVELKFGIAQAENKWVTLPNIIRWDYGSFDKSGAVILARPQYLLDSADVCVSMLDINGNVLDGLGNIKVKRVSDITYGECYAVDDEGAVALLNALSVSQYIMRVWVDETDSYTGLPAEDTVFNIRKTENSWITAPSIKSWTAGKFNADENMPIAQARFGDAVVITVTDAETGEIVYFDSSKDVNELNGMRAGLYSLSVKVDGTSNYGGLSFSQNFKVFERDINTTIVKNGIPWWGVVLIVIGVVAIIAIVLLILHLKGVLQLITGKMVVKMRANADIDATIAAVRAGRYAAVAAGTPAAVEQAEKEEKKTVKRAAALEKKALTPQERAEQLQAKAKAMRARAAAMKARAQELTMTPEEKREKREAERAAAKEKTRVKTPEEKAEALERKAEATTEQAEQLRAKAEVMKSRAGEMRERAAKRSQEQKDAAKKKDKENAEAEAPNKEE